MDRSASQETVLVTGAASGIGRGIAELLQRSGARVVPIDVQPCEHADGVQLDITDEGSVTAAIARIEEMHGPITGLVNAAGILGKVHPPERVRLSDWERELRVDLSGTYIMARAVGCLMAGRGAGAIVNIASIAGMSSAPTIAYSAAKAGVVSLTQSLARSWGRSGVRVNAVSPGFTRTPALAAGIAAGVLSAGNMEEPTALGRLLEVTEIAEAVAWLLSSKSSGVTGINLPVDAGYLCGVTWAGYQT